MPEFVHLHCHTQYSLLDGACEIGAMMKKASADGQKAIALTDHGNMFGAFKFVAEAEKAGVKPIVGCEFYMVEDRHIKSFSKIKGEKDKRYHQLLLAKNQKGYENLCKLCSLGFIEGLYSKYPRIDKELLVQYTEGLIATSCCIGAEIPQAIIHHGEEKAEELLKWWIDLFGDDFYIELQRHRGLENIDKLGISQEDINQVLIKFARKYNLKLIATNDAHYIDEEDSVPHDLLLCINTASSVASTERFKFPSSDFFVKTQKEMNVLFHDVPEAIDNTMEIYDKIEKLTLARDVLLPNFPIPNGFGSQDDYLRHLSFEGAKKRYGTIDQITEERLNFELEVIKKSGYPGYFLIVQDFTQTARDMGVAVGPGRGSAAGSVVAYCTGITNVDPIKYDLLFERFLNPERVSMPDIDIDFDDVGRQKVIDYVIDKYGKNQVAQIVTYGSMAAKSSLRDVGRVMDIPLGEVDKVAKSFPLNLGATLNKVLADGGIQAKLKGKMNSEDVEKSHQFRKLSEEQTDIGKMIRMAKRLEGSVRNTGIHACGVVITPDDITKYIPVKTDKGSGMLVSQFDNSVAEDAGLLKMDFLGLKTLSIIKDAVIIIKEVYGVEIDPEEVPLDDKKTYELFQRGDTIGIFQYESAGMQKYLKELKPTAFEDIIAMNALYRPGPLEYIPEFIDRKHGRKPVVYDLEDMEEYLHETYGICVAGDTLVHNAITGQQVRIDQLESQVGDFYVQGVDENLETKSAKISYWVCNGKKPVFEVKLRNGATVKMTKNHQVLTELGWKKLEELGVGDVIATPRKLNVEKVKEYDWEKLRVLAYLIADGHLSSKVNAEFISKSDALIKEYKTCLNAFDNLAYSTLTQVREVTRVMVRGTEKEYYHQPNSLVKLLRELGLKDRKGGTRSWEKFVPDFIFSLSEKQIAFFLASIWDCDGHIAPKLAHYKTISKQLAQDVQTLLLRLGINSIIYEADYFKESTQEIMTAYQVTLYNLTQFTKYIVPHLIDKEVPATANFSFESKDNVSRELLLEELDRVWTGTGRGLMKEYGFNRQHLLPKARKRKRISTAVVTQLTDVLEFPQTSKNLNIRWEEITSITYIGEELVYDITVEDIHNFVGNNIILHNCVYQEQVMLLSQKLANFSKGEADTLRKAMGKKKKALVDKMWPKFVEGCKKNGHPEDAVKKIWTDWEAFASYAFNKSHSTCYAFVAFQTAYLKAHYPAAFMASVLTHNKSDISKVTFFLSECKRMDLEVLGPDINESQLNFTVNKQGQIRFGMSALKGVGEGPVEEILLERKNGPFESPIDFISRLTTKAANKKVIESLVLGGGFDRFEGMYRSQYFGRPDKNKEETYIEAFVKFGSKIQAKESSLTLFDVTEHTDAAEPAIPDCEPWPLIERLTREKQVTGIYISGHPLDEYQLEVANFTTCSLDKIENFRGTAVKIAAFVTGANHRISKKGTGYGYFTIQDYNSSMEFPMFTEDYQNFKNLLEAGQAVFIHATYQKRWNSEEYQLKISKVELLESIAASLTSSITLKIPIEHISKEMVDGIDVACNKHKGKHKLKVHLFDRGSKTKLHFISKERMVNANNELIKELDQLGIMYKVN